MATLELEKTQVLSVEEQAQQHNAMIKERYRRLQDAEHNQFASETPSVHASVLAPETPVYAPSVTETPKMEQVPQITEYVPTRAEVPVFTTEKFTTATAHVVETPVAPTQAVSAPVELYAPTAVETAQYMLSSMAKTVMAVFTLIVVAMLTLICVNSHIIRQKTVRIQDLEEKKEQLVDMNEEIQRRIQAAQSEETIAQYATSQGMILGN